MSDERNEALEEVARLALQWRDAERIVRNSCSRISAKKQWEQWHAANEALLRSPALDLLSQTAAAGGDEKEHTT
jgi:hypothetical protein